MSTDQDKHTVMTLETFEQRIVSHGTNLATWPPADQRAAQALIARSETAARRLSEERRLNETIVAAAPAIDDVALNALSRRIAAAAHALPQKLPAAPTPRVLSFGDMLGLALAPLSRRLGRWAAFAMPAGGLATLALAGFLLGSAQMAVAPGDAYAADDSLDLTVLAFGTPLTDIDADWP